MDIEREETLRSKFRRGVDAAVSEERPLSEVPTVRQQLVKY
jgi:hypothetical protein